MIYNYNPRKGGKLKGIAVKPIDRFYFDIAQKRLNSLTKPKDSLGLLEEFAKSIVAITENENPCFEKKIIFIFAGDHGVTEEGVSAYPKEVTSQMVFNFIQGGAAINCLSRHAKADVRIVDIGVDYDFKGIEGLIQKKIVWGTKNFSKGPALTRKEALKCIEVGVDIAREYAGKGFNIFGTGDMGIGNTTAASAIASVMTGTPVAKVTGRGTGISDPTFLNKIKIIKRAISINRPDPKDPIDVLSKVGGAEIAGIAGLIIGGAEKKVPVVIDGLISTAGAIIACALEPNVRDYIFASHLSVEAGHVSMLKNMGLEPILDLKMRLGEGTGAVLAMFLIEAGVKVYNEMATFKEAGVSERIV